MDEKIQATDTAQVRYCKKCGCELMSTNTHKLCENCRRKKWEKIGSIGKWIGTGLFAAGAGLLSYFSRKESEEGNEEQACGLDGNGTPDSEDGASDSDSEDL